MIGWINTKDSIPKPEQMVKVIVKELGECFGKLMDGVLGKSWMFYYDEHGEQPRGYCTFDAICEWAEINEPESKG